MGAYAYVQLPGKRTAIQNTMTFELDKALQRLLSSDPITATRFIAIEALPLVSGIRDMIKDRKLDKIEVRPEYLEPLVRMLGELRRIDNETRQFIDGFYHPLTYAFSPSTLERVYEIVTIPEINLDLESRRVALCLVAEHKSTPDHILHKLSDMTYEAPWLYCEIAETETRIKAVDKIKKIAGRTIGTKEASREISSILSEVGSLGYSEMFDYMNNEAIPRLNGIALKIREGSASAVSPNFAASRVCLNAIVDFYNRTYDREKANTLENFSIAFAEVVHKSSLKQIAKVAMHRAMIYLSRSGML